MRQRDKFGHLIDRRDLPKFIVTYEQDLKRMKWVLLKLMDNSFYQLKGKDPEEIRKYFEAHFALIKEEYEKNKKILGGLNVI